MEQKKPFQRLNVQEIQKKRENEKVQQEISQRVDAIMSRIDERIDVVMVELIKELGYNASEDMSHKEYVELHEKMLKAGHYITVETEQKEMKYIVKLQVVQVARILEFDLGS